MCFKSYSSVFSSSNIDFLLNFTFQNIDFKRISLSLYSQCYSQAKSKNTPYDPSSLLRLFIIYNLYFTDLRFFKDSDIYNIPIDYLKLCGFDVNENLPSHSTYYYFLKRIGYARRLYYLNMIQVQILKWKFRLFTCKYTKKDGKFIILAMDSKPIEIDGNVPKGTIHSHNKRLNEKLGMKVHSISIVYPFYFPIVFKFTPGHYHDSPVFRELFTQLEPLLKELNLQGILTFVAGDCGYDSVENTDLITKQECIPCIAINKRNHSQNKSKLDMLIFSDDRYYCINNLEKSLHFNGHDRACQKLMLYCYYFENCKHNSTCSKNFKFKELPHKLSNESLLISKLRLDIFPSEMYKYIYKFRSRIETIHAIWSNALKLGNKFYFHNFKELFRFELSIISFSFNHFMNESKASVKNYFY